jgi:hypothetical protein
MSRGGTEVLFQIINWPRRSGISLYHGPPPWLPSSSRHDAMCTSCFMNQPSLAQGHVGYVCIFCLTF